MKDPQFNRRKFLRNTVTSAAGMLLVPDLSKESITRFTAEVDRTISSARQVKTRIGFAVIGVNNGHINGMVDLVTNAGGQIISFYAKETDLAAAFSKRYPKAKIAISENEILEDKSVQLVLSCAIPDERAPLGILVMQHGKDFLTDKPGMISLDQLKDVRRVQKETGRIYSIMIERFENRAAIKAGELVKAGAIGRVIQTIGTGPHRMTPQSRPEWFFDKKRSGGILNDLASHQFDQFLFYTGSTTASVVTSQVGNFNHPQYPKIEDFGDVLLRGNGGTGYIRVDWFTPDGLSTWGDGRVTILGTEGYIEIRKSIDIASQHPGGEHIYLVNQKETHYIDCSKDPLHFGELLVNDILNRTETAVTQEHCFLAAELGLRAQKNARNISSAPA